MGRTKRLYMPGAVFHITARTHCGEGYFHEAIRDELVDIIARSARRSDALIIAYAIMPNHYHLVVQQQQASLAQLVQAISRRIALAVQRDQRRKGSVFGSRFHAKPCADARHMREMIVYTHRNPVRAKLCSGPDMWNWNSHWAYVDHGLCATTPPSLYAARELFVDDQAECNSESGYLAFLRWKEECDNLPDDALRPRPPNTRYGDIFYSRQFGAVPPLDFKPTVDLCDIIRSTLSDVAPELTLEDLQTGSINRRVVSARRAVIIAATRCRHRVCEISHTLQISESAVSRVAVTVSPRPPIRFDNRSGHFPF
jgi:REP element-mobilizing transposase RayT